MRYWINAVGYGIPVTIRLTKKYIYKGSPLYKIWYGRYDLRKSFWGKIKLILKNG